MALQGETIWVTGASSGIGKEITLQLAQAGNTVIASGRNQERLTELQSHNDNIKVMVFDVTDRAGLTQAAEELQTLAPALDRVILNAGDCEYLDIEKPDWQSIGRMMNVNLMGVVNSIEVCLPLLKKNPTAHIVAVGSQAILAPFPRAEGYGGSKAALSYLLASLRMDLRQFNIDVTEILPGFIDTPLTQRNDFPMPFMLTAPEAAKRILQKIPKRPLQYAFPRRLSLVLKVASAMPRLWLWLNTRNQTENADNSTKRSKHA